MLILEFQTDVNMSSRAYNSFVNILEKWPVDKTKAGKDLGEALRLLFSKTFPSGSSSVVNEKTVNKYEERCLCVKTYQLIKILQANR